MSYKISKKDDNSGNDLETTGLYPGEDLRDNPVARVWAMLSQMSAREILTKHGRQLPALVELCDRVLSLGLIPEKGTKRIRGKVLEVNELPPIASEGKVAELPVPTEKDKPPTPPPPTSPFGA